MATPSNMQVAVVDGTSNILAMPHEDFVATYCHPIQDDSWIRQESIVKLEDVVDSDGAEAVKAQVLSDYIAARARDGNAVPPDPILHGMALQEQFMQEYKREEHSTDSSRAASYRSQLFSEYRKTRPAAITDRQQKVENALSEARGAGAVKPAPPPPQEELAAQKEEVRADNQPEDQEQTESPEVAQTAEPVEGHPQYPVEGDTQDQELEQEQAQDRSAGYVQEERPNESEPQDQENEPGQELEQELEQEADVAQAEEEYENLAENSEQGLEQDQEQEEQYEELGELNHAAAEAEQDGAALSPKAQHAAHTAPAAETSEECALADGTGAELTADEL